MIQKLRRKFIAAAMASLALVLLVILGGVNWMGYQKAVSDADAILALLSSNQGVFPPLAQIQGRQDAARTPPWNLSPETPYESRYFSVFLDETGQPVRADMGQIAAVDEAQAREWAARVWASGRTSGFLTEYRFHRCDEPRGSRIIFLDCDRSLSAVRTTLFSSLLVSALGLGAVFLLLLLLSGRIVRPMAESYEKQRRFITDAGHELKTPLTIIGADTDLAEMEFGENEWLADIRRQTRRLSDLTEDLIYLSRMEEERPPIQPIEFPLSDVAEEMAQSFQAASRQQGKELETDIQPMLSCTGDEKAIRQLFSILLDNAMKYAPAGGRVALRVFRQGRTVQISVSNPTVQPVDRDQLGRLFERFYRGDSARDSQTAGHGLGLSIARSIVQAHKGTIRAESPDGCSLTLTISLAA